MSEKIPQEVRLQKELQYWQDLARTNGKLVDDLIRTGSAAREAMAEEITKLAQENSRLTEEFKTRGSQPTSEAGRVKINLNPAAPQTTPEPVPARTTPVESPPARGGSRSGSGAGTIAAGIALVSAAQGAEAGLNAYEHRASGAEAAKVGAKTAGTSLLDNIAAIPTAGLAGNALSTLARGGSIDDAMAATLPHTAGRAVENIEQTNRALKSLTEPHIPPAPAAGEKPDYRDYPLLNNAVNTVAGKLAENGNTVLTPEIMERFNNPATLEKVVSAYNADRGLEAAERYNTGLNNAYEQAMGTAKDRLSPTTMLDNAQQAAAAFKEDSNKGLRGLVDSATAPLRTLTAPYEIAREFNSSVAAATTRNVMDNKYNENLRQGLQTQLSAYTSRYQEAERLQQRETPPLTETLPPPSTNMPGLEQAAKNLQNTGVSEAQNKNDTAQDKTSTADTIKNEAAKLAAQNATYKDDGKDHATVPDSSVAGNKTESQQKDARSV